MLTGWLDPMTLAAFKRDVLRKQPYARPGSAAAAVHLIGWEIINRILARESPDVLVVGSGKLAESPRPRSLEDLRLLMQSGLGIVVRRAEREDSALAELAVSFAQDLGGAAQLQLIVTPGGTNGFSWHYDREEVFIAQTVGIKDYFFRENTVIRDIQTDAMDFTAFRREVSPLATATLIAGDWLYIPAGWWHMAKCVEDSLSMSMGVLLQ